MPHGLSPSSTSAPRFDPDAGRILTQIAANGSTIDRASTGQVTVLAGSLRPKRLPIRYSPLEQLVIYALPFPKGAPTAPELLARQPGDWSAEVTELQTRLDRFVASGPEIVGEHRRSAA
jgi:hypothetical protein